MKLLLLITFMFTAGLHGKATVHKIKVSNFQFSPKRVNALVGDTILWVYKNGFHTTSSTTIPGNAAPWDSPMDVNTTRFVYVLTVPGTYNYFCVYHAAEMTGLIKVFAATSLKINSLAITKKDDGKPHLSWALGNAASIKKVSVLRSYDGEMFKEITAFSSTGACQVKPAGSYTDNTAVKNGYVYYMLEVTDCNNETTQSSIDKFSNKNASRLIVSLSPNPGTSPHLQIKFNAAREGTLKVVVQNGKGNILIKEDMSAEPGINNAHLHLGDRLKAGVYYIIFVLDGVTERHKLIRL